MKLAICLFAGLPLFADLSITSFSPISGPTAGGTEVTIRGSGFSDACAPNVSPCLSTPPVVYFDSVPAETRMIDSTTLVVITPTFFPTVTRVSMRQGTGNAAAPGAFLFIGKPQLEAYERVLLPIFTPPTFGAFGSEFHTELHGYNSGTSEVSLFGIEICIGTHCLGYEPFLTPQRIGQQEILPNEFITYSGTPGSFVYVRDSERDQLVLNLRVFDVSRAESNFGTEVPIVHEHELRNDRVDLLGVPLDPMFRKTLRVYATKPMTVLVTIGRESRMLGLTQPLSSRYTSSPDTYYPAHGAIADFPTGSERVTVTVQPMPGAPANAQFWAFISVTNNETQHITTIAPQR